MRGFAVVGLYKPKNPINVGGVLRAAGCYGAALVVVQNRNQRMRMPSDPQKMWRHLPVIRGDDLFAHVPYDAIPIAVDLLDDAEPLPGFAHPERAFYVFGPEDGTLPPEVVARCAHSVYVPTRVCMNLAASANVVLYDRLAKSGGAGLEEGG